MYMVVLDEEKCTGCDSCAEGCQLRFSDSMARTL